MIADNMIYYAIFVFVMMIIGLVLTVFEFRYGEPKRQQQAAARKSALRDESAIDEKVRPAP